MDEKLTMEQEAQEEVVAPQEGAEGSEAEKGGNPAVAAQAAEKQTHEDNREAQAARRAGEKIGEERARKAMEAEIASYGIVNPATGKPFTTREELKTYGAAYRRAQAKERAEKEGRDVEDVLAEDEDRAYLRRKRAEESESEKKTREADERRAWMRSDLQAFRETYPEADVGKLEENKAFLRFCGSRFGREPLAELYADYLEIASESAKAATLRADDKKARSTGAGSGAGGDTLTGAQQKALDEWNRMYPTMKMTAAEFLKY